MLIGQLMVIVTHKKEEKENTYTYYKRAKELSTPGGNHHQILFFRFFSGTNTYQENRLFCVIQSSTSDTVFFPVFLNDIENGVFRTGFLIVIVNPDPIEDYINCVPIIVSNEQSILMLPMNQSPIPMQNDLKANTLKGFFIQHSRIQVGRILFLDTKSSEKLYYFQNILLNNNKPCGCFSLRPSRSNIIYMQYIFFPTDIGETKTMRKFSSLHFWRHS